MTRKRIWLLPFACLALVFGSCQFRPPSFPVAPTPGSTQASRGTQPVETTPAPVRATPAPVSAIVLAAKGIRQKSDAPAYEIDARWPYLEWGGDPRAEVFNQAAEAIANEDIRQFQEGIAKLPDDESSKGLTSSLKIDFMPTNEKNDLLSELIQVSTYAAGAAHPGHYAQSINFDLRAGRVLALADLFQPGSDYLRVLSSACIDELKARDALVFEEGAQPKAENFQVWNITPEGLLITFDEYQVAPYALGPQSVMVPYDKLKGLSRANGPLAPFFTQ